MAIDGIAAKTANPKGWTISLNTKERNSYIAFAVHGSRASPRTACALTVHPELVEGFFEL
jgi:hypothetical protein